MPNYRSLEPVTYIEDGAVVSVAADRTISLTDDQAVSLAGRVVLIKEGDTMFPDGQPLIEHTIVRHQVTTFEVEVEPLPAPSKRLK